MLHGFDSVVHSFLSLFQSDEDARTRRRHARHMGIPAEVTIGNRAYSVKDWSLGGVSFETAPDARLLNGDVIHITMKFRLPHLTVTVTHQAQIVRTARHGIAAKFSGMSSDVRRQFDRVLDSLHTQSFLESQIA